ncbi:MAG: hypothetical protein JSV61_16320 [Anaerolineales bacterium]|nr:MAG: hypothetical protein JSV61_16320 [Anaerolineales bacterium]
MNTTPSKEELRKTLDAAWDAHREFQKVYLKGVRDEAWPGWYAAYVLGRLGDFMAASLLASLLEAAPESDDWSKTAAEYVLREIGV